MQNFCSCCHYGETEKGFHRPISERVEETDLVEKEEAELKVIQEFMPEQMSEEDIDAEIRNGHQGSRRC